MFFFHSTHVNGPEPTYGGLFMYPFSDFGAILDQTCSGRIGTQWRVMSGFGLEHTNCTV